MIVYMPKANIHISHVGQTANFPQKFQHEFHAIPKSHKRESNEETEGATKFCHQGFKVVEEGLFFNHYVRRHVPQNKAKVPVGFLKYCICFFFFNNILNTYPHKDWVIIESVLNVRARTQTSTNVCNGWQNCLRNTVVQLLELPMVGQN